jgi:hypothetical protein
VAQTDEGHVKAGSTPKARRDFGPQMRGQNGVAPGHQTVFADLNEAALRGAHSRVAEHDDRGDRS